MHGENGFKLHHPWGKYALKLTLGQPGEGSEEFCQMFKLNTTKAMNKQTCGLFSVDPCGYFHQLTF